MTVPSIPLYLLDALGAVNNFFNSGGSVLYAIIALVFIMWTLILERFWYYTMTYQHDLNRVINVWNARVDKTSWNAHVIREKLISEIFLKIDQNLSLIKTMIAICPLLGLFGTVIGMIEVFTILSVTGGSDSRSMAKGVSHATIPTMSGMVAALSGVFANVYISQKAVYERRLVEGYLVTRQVN